MRLLEDSLAEAMLSGQIKNGDTAIVVNDDGEVRVVKSESELLLLFSRVRLAPSTPGSDARFFFL